MVMIYVKWNFLACVPNLSLFALFQSSMVKMSLPMLAKNML